MEYLTKKEIIIINKMTVERHGGNFVLPFNFLNEAPLDYLMEAVQAEMFDTPLYPKLSDKAGLYMFNIISNHVFQDGNKRTGLAAALIFLEMNGYQLKEQLRKISKTNNISIPSTGTTSNEILISYTLELAAGLINLEECQRWFKENIIKVHDIEI